MFLVLQSRRPATEPRNLETPMSKCILNALRGPRKVAQIQAKCPRNPSKCQFHGLFGQFLMDFWGHPGGSKVAFFGLSNAIVPGSVAGRRSAIAILVVETCLH